MTLIIVAASYNERADARSREATGTTSRVGASTPRCTRWCSPWMRRSSR